MHKEEKANFECALFERTPKERQKGLPQSREFLPNFYASISLPSTHAARNKMCLICVQQTTTGQASMPHLAAALLSKKREKRQNMHLMNAALPDMLPKWNASKNISTGH